MLKIRYLYILMLVISPLSARQCRGLNDNSLYERNRDWVYQTGPYENRCKYRCKVYCPTCCRTYTYICFPKRYPGDRNNCYIQSYTRDVQ